MVEVKVQQITKSLYICLPVEVLRDKKFPPLDLKAGDVLVATRTERGIHYESSKYEGSTWALVPQAV